jgi:PhoH-like ATPase
VVNHCLTSAYALEDSDKKAFITRPPIGINSKYNIGYVPGDKEEKMVDWLAGFTSCIVLHLWQHEWSD